MQQNKPKMLYTLSTYQTPACLKCWLYSSKHRESRHGENASKAQIHNNLLKVSKSKHIISKNAIQQQPQIVHNTFQNQKEEERFSVTCKTTSSISNLITLKNHKHVMQTHGIEQSQMDLQNLTFGECGTLSLICLKYSIGSLKTHSKDLIYHMLVKLSNSPPQECDAHKTIKKTLCGL